MLRSSVLRKARRLERNDQHLEALRLLNEAAERSDDGDLQERVVRARHEAALSCSPAPGRPEWPPPPHDDVALAGVPPEVDASALDVAAISTGIGQRGCLAVRHLLDAERIDRVRGLLERAYAAADGPPSRSDGWFVPFEAPGAGLEARRRWARDAGAMWLSDSPRALHGVLQVFDELGLPDLLTEYFGERPMFTLEKATFRRVTPTVTPDWHQDGAFMGPGLRSLNLWITLTACGGDADVPALDILPRRLDDFVETGTGGALLDDFVGREVIAQLAEDCAVMRPRFDAGDALIFDDHFLHCTGVGPGTVGERLGIEFWFFAPSAMPAGYQPMVL